MKYLAKLPALALCSVAIAACAPQPQFEPIRAEPVFNKYAAVTECVSPDGRVFSASAGQPDPCLPSEDCPGGFVSSAGEYICPEDVDRGDEPGDGPFGTQADPTAPGDPRTPDPTPPAPAPGGLATVGTGRGT
ncbi:hypothetical protein [Rhodophyticola porphyridii]|uniref:hypothetical protein n=1 Tax=Rhodophyticola porphyridii TaxID=1852017 RepID=UPI0035CF78AE